PSLSKINFDALTVSTESAVPEFKEVVDTKLLPVLPAAVVLKDTGVNSANRFVLLLDYTLDTSEISDAVLAPDPKGVNMLVVVRRSSRTVGRYSNNALATQPILHVYLLRYPGYDRIGYKGFKGGYPDSEVVTGGHPLGRKGSMSGSDPKGMESWVTEVLT